MEHLRIQNFLVIKKAEIEIKELTLLIGPQANGKSVIARLLQFFKSHIQDTFFSSIKDNLNKRGLDKQALSNFEKAFPRYTWEGQEFIIEYHFEPYIVSIISTKKSDGRSSVTIHHCRELLKIRNTLKRNYDDLIVKNLTTNKRLGAADEYLFYEAYSDAISSSPAKRVIGDSIFIPAGRSFFANVHENIFSLLASGTFEFDHLLTEFGSRYTTAKRYYNQDSIRRSNTGIDFKSIKAKLDENIKAVLKGEYLYEKKKDWIKSGDKKISIANSSSGQQEALPLLILLTFWPYVGTRSKEQGVTFIIEEPEAHLFPISQKHIINLLALIYNTSGERHKFLLTTHSPYVLTAINLLIMSNEALQKHPNAEINPDLSIPFEKVSAYKIEEGIAEDILDQEYRLIGSSIIDQVSIDFDEEFTRLLNIAYS